jgi:hypothetical protein
MAESILLREIPKSKGNPYKFYNQLKKLIQTHIHINQFGRT